MNKSLKALQMPKISIIVPIFNVEKYLLTCLKSIQNQTFRDFEAILVDDGSEDSSKKIAQNFIEDKPNFKLISQKNRGVSSARNVGLKNAKGEWITFIDSDDFVEINYLETLYKNAIKGNVLICIGRGRELEHLKEPKILTYFTIKGEVNSEKILKYLNIKMQCYVCKMLINSDFIKKNNLAFLEDVYFLEDIYFSISLYSINTNVLFIDDIIYNYRVRQGSLTHSNFNEKKLSFFKKYDKFIKMQTDKLTIRTSRAIFSQVVFYNTIFFIEDKKMYRYFLNLHKKNLLFLLSHYIIRFPEKIKAILVFSPRLFFISTKINKFIKKIL